MALVTAAFVIKPVLGWILLAFIAGSGCFIACTAPDAGSAIVAGGIALVEAILPVVFGVLAARGRWRRLALAVIALLIISAASIIVPLGFSLVLLWPPWLPLFGW